MKVASDLIKEKQRDIVSTPASTTLADALSLMQRENVGCLLITKDHTIVGIWTERDLVRNIVSDGFDIGKETVGRYMSQPLITCNANDSAYTLVDKFLGLRIRHLVVEQNGEIIGLISAGDVMRASIQEKDAELAKANADMGWDYYEEWKRL